MSRGIDPQQCLTLLKSLQIGSSVAEDDSLLFESRLETAVFAELLSDHIDIVRGTKGSGKSALYRLVADFLKEVLLFKQRIIIVKGVETKGDPIFTRFRPEFDQLDEVDFENFWRIYFISLITSKVLGSAQYVNSLAPAKKEIAAFKALAKKNGFPIKDLQFSLPSLVAWVLAKIPRAERLEASVGSDGAPKWSVDLAAAPMRQERTPVFVAEIHEALIGTLEKADLRLWIMLDRLDEAFLRRTDVERIALRALLRATQAFKSNVIRLKIFLRDDIFDSVTDVPEGFVALTHVMSRCSPVLRWSREQILQLITNRLFIKDGHLARYFSVDVSRLRSDEKYRTECFYLIFPRRLRAGARQSETLDWICKHCEDANGVITPRDVIDLVNYARDHQYNLTQGDRITMISLLSPAAVLSGHAAMSHNKRENYLKAEFPHFWSAIERFMDQKAEHDEKSLRGMLGTDYKHLKNLCAVGFLKHNPRAKTFTVPFLYRPGLRVRQGRSIPDNDAKKRALNNR